MQVLFWRKEKTVKFPDLFRKRFSKEEAARLLKTRPEAMEAFEKAYGAAALLEEDDNFFKINSKFGMFE